MGQAEAVAFILDCNLARSVGAVFLIILAVYQVLRWYHVV